MHRDITRERERCVASTHPRQNNPRVRNSALFMVRGCEASGRLSSKQDTSAAHHIHDSGQFQQGTDSVRSSEIRLTLTPVNHRGNISHLSLITLLIAPSLLLFFLFTLLCSSLGLVRLHEDGIVSIVFNKHFVRVRLEATFTCCLR